MAEQETTDLPQPSLEAATEAVPFLPCLSTPRPNGSAALERTVQAWLEGEGIPATTLGSLDREPGGRGFHSALDHPDRFDAARLAETVDVLTHFLSDVDDRGLPLETTHMGKAMAAPLDHARRHPRARLLFVDTYAEAPTPAEGDYRDLPIRFWPIFDPSHSARCGCLRAWRDPEFCWKERH
jgi:hypothetical protein